MKIVDRLAQWWLGRDSTAANPEPWFWSWALGGSQSASGIAISQVRAMQESTCMACVLIRAGDLAKCPLHVYRIAESGAQLIENSAAERLLRKPNIWQTTMEFVEMMQAALLLKQNAYAVILRNGRAEPIGLVPVNPDRVTLYEATAGDLFYQVTRSTNFDRMVLAGVPDPVPASEMLHVRGLSLNGLLGLSRIYMMRDALGLSLAQEQTAARLFGNGAHPSIVLTTERNVTDTLYEQTRARFRERSQGLDRVGEMLLLGNGVKPTEIQMNMINSEWVAIYEKVGRQIATGFDVPPHRLGLAEHGDILKVHQMYLNNTIAADAARIEAKLNQLFGFDGIKMFVEFDLDQFNRADPATRAETARVQVVGGLISPNEYRRGEGLPAMKGGDTLFRPANVVPIDTPVQPTGAGPGSDTTGKPAPGGAGDPNGNPGKDAPNGAIH